MASFIALLRAVNVGGTGKLAMADLKTVCEAAGFRAVRTYIASGNVVFESEQSETDIKETLEDRLLAYANKHQRLLERVGECRRLNRTEDRRVREIRSRCVIQREMRRWRRPQHRRQPRRLGVNVID